MTARPLVLYHANCADGFCAAWVARRRFGKAADYVPVQYGQGPPEVVTRGGREVFILDFSYRRPVLLALAGANCFVTVLDHHRTAEAELRGLEAPGFSCTFDMEKSGGRLAWDFFFPDEPAPWLVKYTEDRDLWRWKLPNSREVSAVLASYPHEFERWDRWDSSPDPPIAFLVEGRGILQYQERQVEAICACAREVELGGYRVLAANTPVLVSEVAGKLAEGRPFGAAWSVRSDGKKRWDLRSRDGGVDVSEVAKRRGGGGHARAAGFEEDA